MNQEVLAEYAELLQNGTTFPPVTVFFDGVAYWLADGFHRYHAHRTVGRDSIATDIQDGGLREAILYSVGANAEHGLRRTNEDKRKAVETMLTNDIVSKDDKGNPHSDNSIAKHCCVHHTTVGRIRKDLSCAMHKIGSTKRTVKRGNSTYTQDTAKIGKSGKKRKKQYGGIAPDAFTPKRTGQQFESRAAIELPYNPDYAANAIVSVMGGKLAVEIAKRIFQIAEEL
jgi:hypothetical protein